MYVHCVCLYISVFISITLCHLVFFLYFTFLCGNLTGLTLRPLFMMVSGGRKHCVTFVDGNSFCSWNLSS